MLRQRMILNLVPLHSRAYALARVRNYVFKT